MGGLERTDVHKFGIIMSCATYLTLAALVVQRIFYYISLIRDVSLVYFVRLLHRHIPYRH